MRRTSAGSALGQSTAEYLVIVSLVALALAIGPNSALEQLFGAIAQRYAALTYAISRP